MKILILRPGSLRPLNSLDSGRKILPMEDECSANVANQCNE